MARKAARRQRGEGSIYQRGDGQWVGTLTLGYRSNGARRRKTIYGRTQRDVVRKLAEVKRELAKHGDLPTAGMTLQAWMDRWLDEIAPATGTPGKMRGYREKSRNYIEPALGRVRLDKLQPQHVRDLHRHVIDELGLSPTTAYNAHRVLSVALNDAMREGVATRNVASIIRAPQPEKDKGEAFSVAEARALGHQIEGIRLESRWLAALLLGARKGECLGLRWEYVDLDAAVLDVSWQLQHIPFKHGCGAKPKGKAWPCGHRFAGHCADRALDMRRGFEHLVLKGNLCLIRPKTELSQRLLPIPTLLLQSLRRRRLDYLDERKAPGYIDHDLVWARLDGRPIDAWDDGDEWKAILAAAGVRDLPLHGARHTSATLLQAHGVPESTRMMILGHSSATMARRYAHRDLTLQRQALEQLGESLSIES